MAPILLPLYPDRIFETYTLRNVDANAFSRASDISFHGTQRLNEDARSRIDVYRGQLALSADEPPLDIVCKIGYRKKASTHEASLYSDTLRHLQDVCIPLCHGYFAGDTDEGPTACTLLAYCGGPIQDMLMHLPPAFKQARRTGLVNALVGMHDAGVKHLDLRRRNILAYNGRPITSTSAPPRCTSAGGGVAIREGAPGLSKVAEIGCMELYNFFTKPRIRTPAFIRYTGRSFPIKFASDARTLTKMAPSHCSPEKALQEANQLIVEHVEKDYPAEHNKWRLDQRKMWEATSVSTSASDDSESDNL